MLALLLLSLSLSSLLSLLFYHRRVAPLGVYRRVAERVRRDGDEDGARLESRAKEDDEMLGEVEEAKVEEGEKQEDEEEGTTRRVERKSRKG